MPCLKQKHQRATLAVKRAAYNRGNGVPTLNKSGTDKVRRSSPATRLHAFTPHTRARTRTALPKLCSEKLEGE